MCIFVLIVFAEMELFFFCDGQWESTEKFVEKSWNVTSYGLLGGGFKYCLCLPLLGEMIPFH